MRAAFIKAAHDNNKNGTSLIRDFMQRYIDENQSTKSQVRRYSLKVKQGFCKA